MQQQVNIKEQEILAKSWAKKMVAILFSEENILENIPEEKRDDYLKEQGFPPELFESPMSFYFSAEIAKEMASQFKEDLYEIMVVQPEVPENEQNGVLVRFMRSLTWDSMDKFLEKIYYSSGILGILEKVLLDKKPPKIPFWFRYFNSKNMKHFMYNTIDRISNSAGRYDYFLSKYKNAQKEQDNVKQKEQHSPGAKV